MSAKQGSMSKARVFFNNLISLPTLIAVRILTRALRKDKGFYYAYKANIAMAFYDEFRRQCKTEQMTLLLNSLGVNMHDLCNEAATNFMKSWIKKGDRP